MVVPSARGGSGDLDLCLSATCPPQKPSCSGGTVNGPQRPVWRRLRLSVAAFVELPRSDAVLEDVSFHADGPLSE